MPDTSVPNPGGADEALARRGRGLFRLASPQGPAAPASPPEIEARIARVTSGLLADTGFEGRYAAPARLQDRMASLTTLRA